MKLTSIKITTPLPVPACRRAGTDRSVSRDVRVKNQSRILGVDNSIKIKNGTLFRCAV